MKNLRTWKDFLKKGKGFQGLKVMTTGKVIQTSANTPEAALDPQEARIFHGRCFRSLWKDRIPLTSRYPFECTQCYSCWDAGSGMLPAGGIAQGMGCSVETMLWSLAFVLCPSEQQRASLAPSEVSKQRKGKRMHSHLWHFLNAHLLWTEYSDYTCRSWHAEMICCFSSSPLHLRNQYWCRCWQRCTRDGRFSAEGCSGWS